MAVDFIEGLLKITNVVLSIVAGYIAIGMFSLAAHRKKMIAWKWLIPALVFFGLTEIFGALRAFGIYESLFLTHIIPSIVLAFLIAALAVQIHLEASS